MADMKLDEVLRSCQIYHGQRDEARRQRDDLAAALAWALDFIEDYLTEGDPNLCYNYSRDLLKSIKEAR